jgi:penicillin-binding protein 1A
VIVTKITTADGTVVYENHLAGTKAIPVPIADTVTSVLQQVIQRGTGTAAKEGFPVAGKTGTGEEYKNAWFCGYATTLSTAVWAGFPQDERTSMTPPATPITVYGGTWPARIWQAFMAAALANAPPGDFPMLSTTTTTVPSAPAPGPAPNAPMLKVPKVTDEQYAKAAAEVTDAGFTPVRFNVVSDAAPGTVVAQSPASGALAPAGALVTLEVAKPPGDTVTVPNVNGMKQARAVEVLHDAGLEAHVVQQAAPDGQPQDQGRVWTQSPEAGTQLPQGSTVTIYVNPD